MLQQPIILPYTFPYLEFAVRAFIGAGSFALLGVIQWMLAHRFLFSRDWRALRLDSALAAASTLWVLILGPISFLTDLPIYCLFVLTISLPASVAAVRLWRRMGKIRAKEKRLFQKAVILLAATIAILTASLTGFGVRFFFISTEPPRQRVEAVLEEIESQKTLASTMTGNLVKDTTFLGLFNSQSFQKLTEYTQTLLSQSQLNALAVTDAEGFVLAAPHNPRLVDNNLGSLGPNHAKVLSGEKSQFLEPGITVPLVAGAGTPITKGEIIKGAVFSARLIDEDYVKNLANKARISNLGIYYLHNQNGAYVSTAPDQELSKALRNRVQLTDLYKEVKDADLFIEIARTNGYTYTHAGKVITDEDGEILAMVIASETFPDSRQTIYLAGACAFAVLLNSIIFLSPFIVHKLLKKR